MQSNLIKIYINYQKMKNVYYEILKYLNKDQDIDLIIGSYFAGNNSKALFNKINKILYD